MKAIRSHAVGGPDSLVLDEVPEPVPTRTEVLIAVKAAALNYPDVLLIQDLYQAKPNRPFSPGSEISGVVEAVGEGVTRIKPGDRVIGLMAWGGLAEKLALAEDSCIAIGHQVAYTEAAALMVTYATSHYALYDQASLQAGETLIVLGATGGVGNAAVQLGKARGAYVVAAVSSQQKADLALSQGADMAVVYGERLDDRDAARSFSEQLRRACTKGYADVIFDPVGGTYAEPAFRTLGWQGRYLIVGFAAGIPDLPLNLPLLKGAKALGIFYGDFARREPEKRLIPILIE